MTQLDEPCDLFFDNRVKHTDHTLADSVYWLISLYLST